MHKQAPCSSCKLPCLHSHRGTCYRPDWIWAVSVPWLLPLVSRVWPCQVRKLLVLQLLLLHPTPPLLGPPMAWVQPSSLTTWVLANPHTTCHMIPGWVCQDRLDPSSSTGEPLNGSHLQPQGQGITQRAPVRQGPKRHMATLSILRQGQALTHTLRPLTRCHMAVTLAMECPLQQLQDLECPSPNPSPCRPPKGPLVATHPSKGSCSGQPIIMALALPLIKGPTEVPKALLLSRALTGQPDIPTALQHLLMPLCLPIAGKGWSAGRVLTV